MKHMLRLCTAILALTLLFYILPIHGEADIYDEVIRLHVLANSDSTEDQTLKLYVRDSILAVMPNLLANCSTRDEAAEAIRKALPELTDVAEAALRENGSDVPVALTLCTESYPTRTYESLCFPGGRYLSLQVRIGQASGQNWWCVLFPSLCLSAASKKQVEEAFIAVGLTPEQYRIITESRNDEKYKLRFKILEIIEELF